MGLAMRSSDASSGGHRIIERAAIKIIEILGQHIRDIPSFYAEINRVFMAGETWTLGESLDAFNDLLYGGYGAIVGREAATIVWHGFDGSKTALGYETTRAFLRNKLERPDLYNMRLIRDQLDALEQGRGETYIDIVMAIIADHANITVELH